METIRLTMAQAVVQFLARQYVERDGREQPFFAGMWGIFGHGNVAGIGQALEEYSSELRYYRPQNEQAMVHAAIAYAKDRKQFGRPIADNQGLQFMLADMAMKVEAARLMVYSAAARAERGEGNLGFISAASKCFASDVAMEVTTDAVQIFGGAGYTVDFPVERMMRDAKITQLYEGTQQIQRLVIGRDVLAHGG